MLFQPALNLMQMGLVVPAIRIGRSLRQMADWVAGSDEWVAINEKWHQLAVAMQSRFGGPFFSHILFGFYLCIV